MGACQSGERATTGAVANDVHDDRDAPSSSRATRRSRFGGGSGKNKGGRLRGRRGPGDVAPDSDQGDVTMSSSSCPEDAPSRQSSCHSLLRRVGVGGVEEGDASTIPPCLRRGESGSSWKSSSQDDGAIMEIEPEEDLVFHLTDADNRRRRRKGEDDDDDDDSTTEAIGDRDQDDEEDSNSDTGDLDESQHQAAADMILRHPGGDVTSCIVFKIKTTKPDRYVVSPKLGMIPPGTAARIRLRIVHNDREDIIRSSRKRRGDSSSSYVTMSNNSVVKLTRDRFLVQYFLASDHARAEYEESPSYQTLTKIWDGVRDVDASSNAAYWSFTSLTYKGGANGSGSGSFRGEEQAVRVHKHKLSVRHVIEDPDLPLDVTVFPEKIKSRSTKRATSPARAADSEAEEEEELMTDVLDESRDMVIRNAKSLFSSISDHDLFSNKEGGDDDDDAGEDETDADGEYGDAVAVVLPDDDDGNSSDADDISRYSDAEGLKMFSWHEGEEGGGDDDSVVEDDFFDAPMMQFMGDDDDLPLGLQAPFY